MVRISFVFLVQQFRKIKAREVCSASEPGALRDLYPTVYSVIFCGNDAFPQSRAQSPEVACEVVHRAGSRTRGGMLSTSRMSQMAQQPERNVTHEGTMACCVKTVSPAFRDSSEAGPDLL